MRSILLCLLLIAGSISSTAQDVQKIIQKEIVKVWGPDYLIEEQKLNHFETKELKSGDLLFSVTKPEIDSLVGYVFSASASGRYEEFDYVVLCNSELKVKVVKVWKYRSSHGGAIAGKRWLKQFIGYKEGELRYGKDIQALSGATISGNSIVSDVQRVQKILHEFRSHEAN
jgi:Na+-translocating ferredoxin:NAD+ oxidoreductase RnfG subunit